MLFLKYDNMYQIQMSIFRESLLRKQGYKNAYKQAYLHLLQYLTVGTWNVP